MNFEPSFVKKEKEECVGSTKKGQLGGEVPVRIVRYKNVNDYSVTKTESSEICTGPYHEMWAVP
jgi:hypothetical protein